MPASVPAPSRLIVVAGLIWLSPGRVLVQRRARDARHGAGMLELPGGKVERGEAPRAALARELVEEWGPAAADLPVGDVVEVLHHVYPAPGPEVLLLVFDLQASAWGDAWPAKVQPEDGVQVLAFELAQLPVQEFLEADRAFISRLAARGA